MTGRKIKAVIAAAMFGAIAAVATVGSATALEVFRSYDAGCARWSSQGAGQRIKCFDCLERHRLGGQWVWINTCPHD